MKTLDHMMLDPFLERLIGLVAEAKMRFLLAIHAPTEDVMEENLVLVERFTKEARAFMQTDNRFCGPEGYVELTRLARPVAVELRVSETGPAKLREKRRSTKGASPS